MAETEVLFTSDLATVVVDLHRRSAACFDRECSIAYLPCCLLALLSARRAPMTIADFPRPMVASENTLVAAAIKLERAGLIEKTHRESDRRVVVLRATRKGSALVRRAFDGTYRHLRSTVWRWCSDDDVERIVDAFGTAADGLGAIGRTRGHAVHRRLNPAFFIAVATMVRQWMQASAAAGMALTEYRCLALLQERAQPLPCSVVADTLLVDRSTVSVVAKSLVGKGLGACEKGSDKRSRLVSITEDGRAAAGFAASMLEDRTAACYAKADRFAKTAINELHARMYAELAAWVHGGRGPIAEVNDEAASETPN